MDFVLSCRLVNMMSTRLVDFRSSCHNQILFIHTAKASLYMV